MLYTINCAWRICLNTQIVWNVDKDLLVLQHAYILQNEVMKWDPKEGNWQLLIIEQFHHTKIAPLFASEKILCWQPFNVQHHAGLNQSRAPSFPWIRDPLVSFWLFDVLSQSENVHQPIWPFATLLEIIVVLIWNQGAQGFMCFSLFTKYSFSIWRLFFLEIPKYWFTDGFKFIKTRPVPALLFADSFWKVERKLEQMPLSCYRLFVILQ